MLKNTELKTHKHKHYWPYNLCLKESHIVNASNAKLNKQLFKFLNIFKKLHINILFVKALEQIPSYAKFMKDILTHMWKIEDLATVALTEECSAIIQHLLCNPKIFSIRLNIEYIIL